MTELKLILFLILIRSVFKGSLRSQGSATKYMTKLLIGRTGWIRPQKTENLSHPIFGFSALKVRFLWWSWGCNFVRRFHPKPQLKERRTLSWNSYTVYTTKVAGIFLHGHFDRVVIFVKHPHWWKKDQRTTSTRTNDHPIQNRPARDLGPIFQPIIRLFVHCKLWRIFCGHQSRFHRNVGLLQSGIDVKKNLGIHLSRGS